jgi:hypothetical protein
MPADLAFVCGACIGFADSAFVRPQAAASRRAVRYTRQRPRYVNLNVGPVQHSVDTKPRTPAEEAKTNLLNVARSCVDAELDRTSELEHVRKLLKALESTPDARPETAIFAEFALSGVWEAAFSTSPTRPCPEIQTHQLTQTWDISKKTVTNSCVWTLRSTNENGSVDAVLDITSSYSFQDDTPIVDIDAPSHQLRVLERKPNATEPACSLPGDLQGLIEKLQASLPLEFWDCSGQIDPATYMDVDFRVSCMLGERLQGVRSVYKRLPAA